MHEILPKLAVLRENYKYYSFWNKSQLLALLNFENRIEKDSQGANHFESKSNGHNPGPYFAEHDMGNYLWTCQGDLLSGIND